VEIRGGFATEKAAREAGERAKRMVDCICYPNLETLSLLTKAEASPSHAGERDVELKYPWQRLVLDAFMEPDSRKVLYKIEAAEHALARRLGGATSPGSDEHFAIGEALLALGRFLSQVESQASSERKENPTAEKDDEEIA